MEVMGKWDGLREMGGDERISETLLGVAKNAAQDATGVSLRSSLGWD